MKRLSESIARDNAARRRALWRLAALHWSDFARLYREERTR